MATKTAKTGKRESYGPMVKRLYMERLTGDIQAEQVFVTKFSKLSSASLSTLRQGLRKQGVKYRVVKNSVARKVLESKGMKDLAPVLNGQCGLGITSGDVSAASKTLVEFAGENEAFQVLGLYLDGSVYDAAKIKQLAKLPSRHELLGQVCGRMNSPVAGMVNVLAGVMRNLVNVLDQVKKQKEKA